MYSVPKIKRFNTITEQAQKSWRSNLSSDSKRNIILQDITHNLILIKDDLISFFENNKEYLFPTDNEEYICLDSSSSIVPAEELLYRLIDILKNDDFISILEEASSTIESLSKQLDEAKKEIKKYKAKNNNDALSSYRSGINDALSKELINKLKEKNLLNQKISKDYDNLIDEYILGLAQKSKNEEKIKNLEENLKNYENTKMRNEELTENNKQMKDEIFLLKNELNDLKTVNNKLYEDNIKIKDELQRMYKLIEFKNKEYQDLTEKNKLLLKNNYTSNMAMQRNEDKLKLCINNMKIEKERNKEIIDDLEKKINQKDEELNKMRQKLNNNIINLIKENESGNFKYNLDEINNLLKIIYKGQLICCIQKYNREVPTSFYQRKKNKILSNIHPNGSDIDENSVNNYKPMTLSKKNKITEINTFNITYKLSKNEYEFDSGSSNNKSNNSISHSSFRLDQLCEQGSDTFISNDKSKQKSSKSKYNINKNKKDNKVKKCFSQIFRNHLYDSYDKSKKINNIKDIRRSKTDIKGRKLKNGKNKNMINNNSFGFDVESIKEEKYEDSMSISNFDIRLNTKKENEIDNSNNNIKNKINNMFTSISNLLESSSIINPNKYCDKIFVINHVEDFSLNRIYCYPKNVKLNVKKINVKRIIHVNKEKEENSNNNDYNSYEGCYIF